MCHTKTMRRSQRGIFLVTALIMLVLVAMFVGAALLLGQGGASSQALSYDNQQAELAAFSGIQYCTARLVDNPGWRGDGDGLIVDETDLKVYEHRGNVVGVISENGTTTQFRVRFNFQDDSEDDIDGLPDPENESFFFDHPYVSFNNLSGGASVPLPRADGANFAVTSSSPRPSEVPAGSVSLLVEGRAGPGLSSVGGSTAETLNGPVSGRVQIRVIEVTYALSAPPGFDAAAQAAGNIRGRLESSSSGEIQVTSADSSPPRIRSKTHIEVTKHDDPGEAARYLSPADGEVLTPTVSDFFGDNVNSVPINTESGEFYRLAWDKVKKAEAGDPTLAAGTYVVWDDGSLHYYDMSYSDYVSFIETDPTNSGTTVTLPDGLSFDGSGKFSLQGNLLVEGTGTTDELAIIPRKGAQEEPGTEGSGSNYTTDVPSGVPQDFGDAHNYLAGLTTSQASQQGGDLHQFLLCLAPKAQFSMNGGDAMLDWGPSSSVNIGQVNPSVNLLMHGGAEFEVDLGEGPPNPELTTHVNGNIYKVNTNALSEWLGGGGGLPAGLIDFSADPSVDPVKTVSDLEFHFAPPEGETATLSSTGNVRLGLGVFGRGGSITTEGDIRIIGARTDLSANPDGEEGVNLYAKGNIDLFAIVPDDATLADDDFVYADFKLKGIVYTQQDFRAHLGYDHPSVNQWGRLSLSGALIAYGGDPDPDLVPPQDPGANGLGNIDITANSAELVFDPSYLGSLLHSIGPTPLERVYFQRLK